MKVEVINDGDLIVTLNNFPFLTVPDTYYAHILSELISDLVQEGRWFGVVTMFLCELRDINEQLQETDNITPELKHSLLHSGFYIDPENKKIVVTCDNTELTDDAEENVRRVLLQDGWVVEVRERHKPNSFICASYCSVVPILEKLKEWGVAYDYKG